MLSLFCNLHQKYFESCGGFYIRDKKKYNVGFASTVFRSFWRIFKSQIQICHLLSSACTAFSGCIDEIFGSSCTAHRSIGFTANYLDKHLNRVIVGVQNINMATLKGGYCNFLLAPTGALIVTVVYYIYI